MRRIVAIGGGEIGAPGQPVETTAIDEEIVRLAGKTRPMVLFLPTASSDSEEYVEAFEKHFSGRLGCRTDALCLLGRRDYDEDRARSLIRNADAVYVGGGNTAMMMRLWRGLGVDEMLRSASSEGKVMSGLSAGAICWFRFGSSDSRKHSNPNAALIRVTGLGLVNATFCPHYDSQDDREPKLKTMMQSTPGVAIALEDCGAIEVIDDSFRVLTSKPSARAFRVYWSRGEYHKEALEADGDYRPLRDLLSKRP